MDCHFMSFYKSKFLLRYSSVVFIMAIGHILELMEQLQELLQEMELLQEKALEFVALHLLQIVVTLMVLQAPSHPLNTLNLLLTVCLRANGKSNVMEAMRRSMSNQKLDMNWTTAVKPMFKNARINGP